MVLHIPDKLKPGRYELYIMCDPNTWSDPFVMDFMLRCRHKSMLRFAYDKRSVLQASLRGGTEAYDIRTRYPGNVKLEWHYMRALWKSPVRTIVLKTGTRVNNDIYWNNVIYTVPAELPDGTYDFRIAAVADDGRSTAKSFAVTVSTPIGLVPDMPSELWGGATAQLSAETSKYAETVNVTLFHGTSHARTFSLAGKPNAAGTAKDWECVVTVPAGIPDGEYTARFTAAAPNGKSQSIEVKFTLANIAITDVKLSGYWNHWRGQTDIFGRRMTDEPHRFCRWSASGSI